MPEALLRALALLATWGVTDVPPIVVVPTAPVASRVTETRAYTRPGDPTIYVLAATTRGDVRQLAATIAHERMHVRCGVSEGPAYDAELAVLRALRADTRAVRTARELHRHDYPSHPCPAARP